VHPSFCHLTTRNKAIEQAIKKVAKDKWGAKADTILSRPAETLCASTTAAAMRKPITKGMRATW
jgi:hypothetical protein